MRDRVYQTPTDLTTNDPAKSKVLAHMPLVRQMFESGSATVLEQRATQEKNGEWILEVRIARPLNGKSKFTTQIGGTKIHVQSSRPASDLTLG